MLAGECGGMTPNSRKRDVRPKRPFLTMPAGMHESRMQSENFIGRFTVCPQQARVPRLRGIDDPLDFQRERGTAGDGEVEPGNGVGD
jgi:hypothetical protein